MDEFKELVETYKDMKENDLTERKNEKILQEMACANNGDQSCKDFQYPKYDVEIFNKEYYINGKPHLHVISTQEKWNIRMSLRGEFLNIKFRGKRSENDTFRDVERAIKKWLPMKCKSLPKITNFEHVQLMWNDHNPELKINIEEW